MIQFISISHLPCTPHPLRHPPAELCTHVWTCARVHSIKSAWVYSIKSAGVLHKECVGVLHKECVGVLHEESASLNSVGVSGRCAECLCAQVVM